MVTYSNRTASAAIFTNILRDKKIIRILACPIIGSIKLLAGADIEIYIQGELIQNCLAMFPQLPTILQVESNFPQLPTILQVGSNFPGVSRCSTRLTLTFPIPQFYEFHQKLKYFLFCFLSILSNWACPLKGLQSIDVISSDGINDFSVKIGYF